MMNFKPPPPRVKNFHDILFFDSQLLVSNHFLEFAKVAPGESDIGQVYNAKIKNNANFIFSSVLNTTQNPRIMETMAKHDAYYFAPIQYYYDFLDKVDFIEMKEYHGPTGR